MRNIHRIVFGADGCIGRHGIAASDDNSKVFKTGTFSALWSAFSGATSGLLRLAMLVVLIVAAFCSTAWADNIYESATLGATGVTGPYESIMYSQWFGARFQVADPVLATRIGGHFVAAIPGSAETARTFFGAVVQLTGPNDMPLNEPFIVTATDKVKIYDWTGSDILARVDMLAPNSSADIRADLPGGGILLQPGYYGIVFGTPGSNSRVGMVTNGSDIGTVSRFDWIAWSEINPGNGFADNWYDSTHPGTRFVVEGAPPVVPEPVSSVLFVTGGTLLAGRRLIRRLRS